MYNDILVCLAPYHISQDHDTILRLFVGLAFGTCTQLGYDATMKRVSINNRPQYEIDVMGKTYCTVDVLSDFAADSLLGRATRVYKVYNTGDCRKTLHVLKDVWVEANRTREGDVLDELLRKILLGGDKQALLDVQRHFLTVVCHGDVPTKEHEDQPVNRFLHRMEIPAAFDNMILDTGMLFHQTHVTEQSQKSGIGRVPYINEHPRRQIRQPNPTQTQPASIIPWTHDRIIFQEVGMVSHNLTSLRDVYQALHDAVEGQ